MSEGQPGGALGAASEAGPGGAIVTLLFTDVVGSTELLDRLGDDEYEALRRTHFSILRHAVQQRGGHEVKSLGDGLMVVFESARDALSAAVSMQQAVGDHNLTHAETAFAVRVGLHTGEPMQDEGDYFGEPVVIAKRLCDSADGGEIRASRLVADLVGRRSDFDLEDLGPVQLKGLGAALPAVRVHWATTTPVVAPMPLVLAAAVEAGPLVGRNRELEGILARWPDEPTTSARIVFVAGEPGIGKTRLAAEAARVVSERGGVVAFGGCDEDAGVPYQPFVEALRSVAAQLGPAGGQLAPELLRLVPELGGTGTTDPGAPIRVDPETERFALFSGVVDVLAQTSTKRPLLLVLDDLQWAAKPTLLLLRHLLRSSAPQSMLVIATYRHTEVDRRHPLAAMLADLRREPGVDRVALRGLDLGAVTSMVRAAGHAGDEQAATLGRALHAETDGNPFFIGEVLRHLAETGAVDQLDGAWESDGASVGQLGLPESVREVIGRRLSRLSDVANGVLRMAAVVGPTFSPTLLADLPDAPDDQEALLDALDEAHSSGLLVESGPGYGFAHDLIRQTLLSELSSARRGRLHRRVGEALEAAPGMESNLGALAHHFAEADEPVKAAEYACRAGRRAMDQLAYEEAIEFFERGLEVIEHAPTPGAARRTELLLALAQALERMNEMTRVREVALLAAEGARVAGDSQWLGDAALLLLSEGIVTVGSGDQVPAEIGDAAVAALGDRDPALRARILSGLARHAVLARGHIAVGTELADRAWELANQSGDGPAIAAALMARGLALEGSWQVHERLALYDELVRRAEGTDAVILSQGRSLRARANLELGNLDAADADIAALERSEGQPWWFSRTVTAIHRAARALLEGRLDDVEGAANEALVHGGKDADVVNGWASQICLLRREQGRLEEILPVLEQALEDSPGIVSFRVGLALVQAELGRTDDARVQLDLLAENDFAPLPRHSTWTTSMALLSYVVALVDDPARAARVYELLEPFAGLFVVVAGTGVCLGAADRHLGILAATLGRYEDAEGHYRTALVMEERLGARTQLARTRYWLGRLLVDRAAPEGVAEARDLLATAATDAAELGLTALADDIRRYPDVTSRPRS